MSYVTSFAAKCCSMSAPQVACAAGLGSRQPPAALRSRQNAKRSWQHVAAAAADGSSSEPAHVPESAAAAAAVAAAAAAAAAASAGMPSGWELANRISSDAMAMLFEGEPLTAEIILKKGIAELQEQHPGDPSTALLHTQLWNLMNEAGQHEAALEQAQAAYDLMLSYFGDNSADAAFHGIRLGISLIATNGDTERAQELLTVGGSAAQYNLEIFWNKLQEMEAAGEDTSEMMIHTKKLMVSLAECNFYSAVGIVRKALQNADELEVPMADLEEAWAQGTKQMAMALPPDHPMFATTLRELARLIPDAAGRPALQQELEAAQTRLRELLYVIKQMPRTDEQSADGKGGAEEEPFLP